ncbi:MAG: hypothetical protein ACI9KS_001482 [Sulfitobacter sp.]|jgi:hypothetical protein
MIRLSLLLTMIGQPALALSCLPYGVQDSWVDASAAAERYVVVSGEFSLTSTTPPRPAPEVREPSIVVPQTQTYHARFEGKAWANGSFSRAITGQANITVNCIAQWCGNLPKGPWVAFLREDDNGGYETETGPCGGRIYADTPNVRGAIRSCASGGACQ